jgi:hypothetical protein
MTYLTIDDRPASPNVLLVDSSNWKVLAVLTVPSNVSAAPYVNPNLTYGEFVEVLMFFETQKVTKSIVLSGSTVLAVLPLIAQAYTNGTVPRTMQFTLVASVQGLNGNANVNKVTFKGVSLASLDPSVLSNATSLVLTITP